MQLLRRSIANELNFAAKLDSNLLLSCIDVLNKSVLKDVQEHYLDPTKPMPSALLSSLTVSLGHVGLSAPLLKIYVTSEPVDEMAFLLFLMVISEIPKCEFNSKIGALVCKSQKEPLDGGPFGVGLLTILKQVHSSHTHSFLQYVGQYVEAHVCAAKVK